MGKIGSFGGVIFEVSHKKVLTISDYSRSGDARWATHDILLRKPIPEFIGPGQETLSMKIVLNKSLGVNPAAELNKLRSYRDKGLVYQFILGTKPISSSSWYIESITEGYKKILENGLYWSIEASLTLKEYPKVATVNTTVKKKTTKKAKPVKKVSSPKSKKAIGTITVKADMLNCRSSPSLKGHIVKVLRKGQKYKAYGTKKTDIIWYDLGGGKYCSASTKYVSFSKG